LFVCDSHEQGEWEKEGKEKQANNHHDSGRKRDGYVIKGERVLASCGSSYPQVVVVVDEGLDD